MSDKLTIGDTLVVGTDPVLDMDDAEIDLTGAAIRAAVRRIGTTEAIYADATAVLAGNKKTRAAWAPATTLTFTVGARYEGDVIAILPSGEVITLGTVKFPTKSRVTQNP